MDEFAEGYDEWSPYTFGLNNPILINDPTGLDTLTRRINLTPVVVTGHLSTYKIYLNRIRLGRSMGLDRPAYYESDGENIRQRTERWHNFENKRFEINKAAQMGVLEFGSMFIPVGPLFKVLRLKKALTLLKLKRGKAAFQVIENNIDEALELGANVADDAVKGVTNTVTRSESVLGHIFRDATGHFNAYLTK